MESISALPEAWPEMEPLEGEYTTQPFPTQHLPRAMRTFIEGKAEEAQVPVDMMGMLALSTASAALQGRLNVNPGFGGWIEPVTLYTATIMNPAERKSAAFDIAMRPLQEWETRVQEAEWSIVAESKQMRTELETRLESLGKEVQRQWELYEYAKRTGNHKPGRTTSTTTPLERDGLTKLQADLEAAKDSAIEAQVLLDTHKTIEKFRLFTNDITPEAATQRLAISRNSFFAAMSDEGGIFQTLSGKRYSETMNLDVFLKGHSGGAIYTDRVGRETDSVRRAVITIGLAVQPAVIEELGNSSKQMVGQGLMARFAWSAPATIMGDREITAPVTPQAVTDRWYEALTSLAQASHDLTDVTTANLTPEAKDLLVSWMEQLEPRLHPETGDLARIADWAGKMAGLALRCSALIASIEREAPAVEITEDNVQSGIALAAYFEDHAIKVFSIMGVLAQKGLEQRIMRHVQRNRMFSFKTRELTRSFNALRGMEAEQLVVVLDELVSMGYLKKITTSLKPLRFYWKANPALWTA